MTPFDFRNCGRILFGREKKDDFVAAVTALSGRALIICGPHFARSGDLGEMAAALEKAGVSVRFIADLKDPYIERVRTAVEICRRDSIGVVVGVGGATVMDFAKIVAWSAVRDEDTWPAIAARGDAAPGRLPLVTVPTFPSSGSELDGAAEIREKSTGHDGGLYGDALIPDLCWLNPAYAMSLQPEFMNYGVMAAAVQASNAFLSPGRSLVAENFIAANIATMVESLRAANADPADEDARGELMLACCLNGYGLNGLGKDEGDFSIYHIEGIVEHYRDLEYVPSLVILFPYWLRAVCRGQEQFADYFLKVWGVDAGKVGPNAALDEAVSKIRELYREFGIAESFDALSPMREDRARLRALAEEPGVCGSPHRTFTTEDICELVLESCRGGAA